MQPLIDVFGPLFSTINVLTHLNFRGTNKENNQSEINVKDKRKYICYRKNKQ